MSASIEGAVTRPAEGDGARDQGGFARYDVVVIGGGAAGLGGALTLARARRSVLVIDAGRPRNAPAEGVHGFLTREGTPPAEIAALGRAEVAHHGGEIVSGDVVALERIEDGFRVLLAEGDPVEAARLLVTTGLVDELPEVPGLAERWGRDVLHCPYCHGWEVRDEPIAVLSTGPMAMHQTLLWRQWSSRVTFLRHTGPEPTPEEYEQLAARGITVVDTPVTGLDVVDDRLAGVRLADGGGVECRALVVGTRFDARGHILADLGLPVADFEMGGNVLGTHIPADALGATEVPGVWVAGNVTSPADQVVSAAAAATRAAAAINMDLIAQETRQAVTALREARAHA